MRSIPVGPPPRHQDAMKEQPRARRIHPGLMAVVFAGLVGIIAACGDGSREAQLSWCAGNQDDVARKALELGLMQPGQRYDDWKSEGEYGRACAAAWEALEVFDRGGRTDLSAPS